MNEQAIVNIGNMNLVIIFSSPIYLQLFIKKNMEERPETIWNASLFYLILNRIDNIL